jgi:hypothetical protein
MKIDQPSLQRRGALIRAETTVHWEDVSRPPQRIYYEIPAEYSAYVTALPEAFLTVATLPAMRLGETRVAIEGEICPELREGLRESMAWIARWKRNRRPVRLDVELGCSHSHVTSAGEGRVAGSLLSGGVDGLSLLRLNHNLYPPGHPRRIEVALVVRGLWDVEAEEAPDAEARLQRALEALEPVARDANITVVPVFTNLHNLSDADMPFWHQEYQGAALASFGHIFAPRLEVLSLASTWTVEELEEWGSHPILDHNYGTHDLAIRHEMATWSRAAKLELLVDWPTALASLRVCNRQPEADVNCSRCEKCLRTMLTLLGMGVLDQATTFEFDDLAPSQLRNIVVTHPAVAGDYHETVALLRTIGRDDLAAAVERRLRVSPVLRQGRRVRSKVKQLDDRYFDGAVSRLRHRLSGRG